MICFQPIRYSIYVPILMKSSSYEFIWILVILLSSLDNLTGDPEALLRTFSKFAGHVRRDWRISGSLRAWHSGLRFGHLVPISNKGTKLPGRSSSQTEGQTQAPPLGLLVNIGWSAKDQVDPRMLHTLSHPSRRPTWSGKTELEWWSNTVGKLVLR